MALNSPIDLQLAQTPRLPPEINPAVYSEFQSVYNAIRNLWSYITVNGGGGEGGDGSWGSITGDISSQLDLMILLGTKITEAPADNNIYGRRNATWVQVQGGISGVSWGDITGNINNQTDLAAKFTTINNSISSLNTDISDLWTALASTNANVVSLTSRVSTVETSLGTKLGDAPVNGNEYVRKNGAWAVASGGGGGGVSGVFMPVVTGDKPPVFLYDESGSLIYAQVA